MASSDRTRYFLGEEGWEEGWEEGREEGRVSDRAVGGAGAGGAGVRAGRAEVLYIDIKRTNADIFLCQQARRKEGRKEGTREQG
jgi:hypothetical protein